MVPFHVIFFYVYVVIFFSFVIVICILVMYVCCVFLNKVWVWVWVWVCYPLRHRSTRQVRTKISHTTTKRLSTREGGEWWVEWETWRVSERASEWYWSVLKWCVSRSCRFSRKKTASEYYKHRITTEILSTCVCVCQGCRQGRGGGGRSGQLDPTVGSTFRPPLEARPIVHPTFLDPATPVRVWAYVMCTRRPIVELSSLTCQSSHRTWYHTHTALSFSPSLTAYLRRAG